MVHDGNGSGYSRLSVVSSNPFFFDSSGIVQSILFILNVHSISTSPFTLSVSNQKRVACQPTILRRGPSTHLHAAPHLTPLPHQILLHDWQQTHNDAKYKINK